jgi:hypothetical protein
LRTVLTVLYFENCSDSVVFWNCSDSVVFFVFHLRPNRPPTNPYNWQAVKVNK